MAVYWPSLAYDFLHWDDDINVFENPHVQGLTAENLRWMFTDFEQAIRYKALSWLTWGVVHELFGLNPFGFHLANVTLHLINTWLVFFLLLALQRRARVETNRLGLAAAAVASLVWALHPLRVEPVAWVTGLPYHLALAFLLGATLCYLRTDFERAAWGQRSYQAAVGFYLLAAMTYPIVLGFPCAVVAVDLAFGRELAPRAPAGRRAWLEKVPFIVVAGLMIAGTLYGRLFRVGEWFQAAGTESFTVAERVSQAGYLWVYYAWKPLWPTGLNPLYDTLLDFSPAEGRFWGSTLIVTVVSGLVLMKWRRWPAIAALWLAHLGLLVPMLGLTEKPHYPHDRYAIVNGVLWSVVLLGAWSRLPSRWRRGGVVVGIVLVLAFGVLSWRQTRMWENDFTFFARLAERTAKAELRAAAMMKLGNAHSTAGDNFTALRHYEQARAVAPRFPLAQLPYNHGTALLRLQRVRQAMEQFQLALSIDPEHLGTLNNLAVCHRQLGEFAPAIDLLRRAVEVAPTNAELLRNLGTTLLESGDQGAAEPVLARSLEVDPVSVVTHRQLAEIYRGTNRQDLANRHSRMAWELEQQLRAAATDAADR